MKNFLKHFKDVLIGLLYLALTAGFMLLVAGAMFYFKPQELIGEAAYQARTRTPEDMALGLKLAQVGALMSFGGFILIKASKKIEALLAAWLKKRAKAEEKEAEAHESQA
jgi:hypothetical protein